MDVRDAWQVRKAVELTTTLVEVGPIAMLAPAEDTRSDGDDVELNVLGCQLTY